MIVHVNGANLRITRRDAPAGQVHHERLPALVMHGGLGWDHTYLRAWFDPLVDILDLLYFDHRGNGGSERPEDWSSITHETWVRDADALRAKFGFDRMLLIGHSYGSFLALEYAIRHPDRLLGLILCAATPILDYFEIAVANARARATDAQFDALMAAMGAALPETDEEMRTGSETVLPIYLHDPHSALTSDLLSEVRYSRDAFVHALTRCLPQYDVRPELHRIAVPTLIVSGADDWITPPEHGGKRLQESISNAEHIVFPASGHFPFAEEPEAFKSTIRKWLAQHRLVSATTSEERAEK